MNATTLTTSGQALVSLRVWPPLWMHEARRAELRALLRQHRATIEEVCFFTSFTCSVLPFATLRERAERLKAILPEFKALGLRTGINHLATFGHLDENLANSLDEPWQRITDLNGTVAKGSYCPIDLRFQEFTRRCYQALAEANPDFIWIDDDVRMLWHPPVEFSCFCDLCLARFGEETGAPWTRERAARVIHPEGAEASRETRAQWVEHNRRIFNEVFALIRGAVDTVNPDLILGYMPTNQLYEGMDYPGWSAILAGPRRRPVKWRPGGGFYTDSHPLDLLRKAHHMGRTAAAIPAGDTDIQYEHENFPYQKLKKSETIFVAETAAALAAGCTGVALNLMGIAPDPFDEYLPYFDRIRDAKPFFDRLAAVVGRRPAEGIWPAYAAGKTWAAGRSALTAGNDDPLSCLQELAEIGLPPAYGKAGARIHLLSGNAIHAFTRAEIEEMLSQAAMIDGPALRNLQDLGLADLAGFEIAGTRDHDTIERFTDDPLNGTHAGWWRDCRPSFWRTEAFILKPLDAPARPLAELIDFNGASSGPVMGVFENRLGGRVATLGYYPWTSLQNLAKTAQMKSVCRWLSRDTLSAYVGSFHKIALWCRRGDQDQMHIALLNASLDSVTGVRLHVRDTRQFHLVRLDGGEELVKSIGHDGPYQVLELGLLGPWEMVVLA